jgi:hypothetical protein
MKKREESRRNQIVIHVTVSREVGEKLAVWAQEENRERTNLAAHLLTKAAMARAISEVTA